MFQRRTIPVGSQEAARTFVIEALREVAAAREAGPKVCVSGGGAAATVVNKPGRLRRYELRRIRQMMLDIYGV